MVRGTAPQRDSSMVDTAAAKPAAKWPQQTPCGYLAVTEPSEQQRNGANGVPRSPVSSELFALVRSDSLTYGKSGRQELEARLCERASGVSGNVCRVDEAF